MTLSFPLKSSVLAVSFPGELCVEGVKPAEAMGVWAVRGVEGLGVLGVAPTFSDPFVSPSKIVL